MSPDSRDPRTWVCEWWWPPKWHNHPYAEGFAHLREFGLLLQARPGPWKVALEAADPVVQYVLVRYGRREVAEVYVDRDGPQGSAPRIRVVYHSGSAEGRFGTAAEAVDALVARVSRTEAEPGATADGGGE